MKGSAVLAEQGITANTVRLYLAPVRALLATAVEDGLIRSNPSAGVRFALRCEAREDERVNALTEEQLSVVLGQLPEEWPPFFEFLAHTGMRVGEAIALTWADVGLGTRRVHVRQRFYRGRYDSPKSKYGRRTIPLSENLARTLWSLRGAAPDNALVFASATGRRIEPSNLMSRVLKPAAVDAGIGKWVYANGRKRAESWVGFHTFRHTCATILFATA
jgi:integrase